MNNLKVTTAQFENRSGDKTYNLSVIEEMCRKASLEGSKVIAFHEASITGYSFVRHLSQTELLALAEAVPDGLSTLTLMKLARDYRIAILAGLLESDEAGKVYNTYVCVDENGFVAKYRKLHPFISPYLSPGDRYCTFELQGWKCGILICYDNNIVENVRATALLGADIIFMPHITMCTPSSRPGAGFVSEALWENRETDPTSLRLEFDGMKGRAWLLKWLPARAYDNGIYVVFSNPIGMDGDQLKNGCSMIVDPFGDIIAECRVLGNDFTSAILSPVKLRDAGGYRYRQARRPELYGDILSQPHHSSQKVIWVEKEKSASDAEA